ncbi:formimidoylglutamate deiminase [Nocardioides sp. JQ2195]|uniref:formimidoylglutamate deiminase n=1 Tax=Nocardioides sp. JQ2195 TaxID=2592334 RepID=UPI00143EE88E|nr:formimidoylglutamate deiminase [Nocardioides sp. JQ2195]QIX25367.1 formimidoylglutamate deiminase [Nocardioides sp. JQ2195]
MSATFLLERALIDDRVEADVLVVVEDGRFTEVLPGRDRHLPAGESPSSRVPGVTSEPVRLAGLSIPGLANCHSHAFHRALRGRTQQVGADGSPGSFWTWREQMYAVAQRLDPDSYHDLARATYREMLSAGITAVGEFHYLHHQPDGTPYADPNAMGHALVAAAKDAGIRIALLDTCYLAAGIGRAPEGVQVRYSDGDAERWAQRVDQLRGDESTVIGAAIHSVRAVPKEQIPTISRWARADTPDGRPLHVHLSEQVAENEQCHAAHGCTPTELLDDCGALGPMTSAVHATHLTDHDLALVGGASAHACFCPTTERDLGDGIGPSRALFDHGARLTLGSDSHAVIDPFEEMRAVELDERLATQQRGHWSAVELLGAATHQGHASLGFADAGRIAVGQRADLVTLDTTSTRTAGTGAGPETAVFAAVAEDVRQVMVDGLVHEAGAIRDEVGPELERAVRSVSEQPVSRRAASEGMR